MKLAIENRNWDTLDILFTTGGVVLLWFLTSTIRSYWRLRHFKGPRVAAFTNLWYARAVATYKPHLILGDVCTKYGSFFSAELLYTGTKSLDGRFLGPHWA